MHADKRVELEISTEKLRAKMEEQIQKAYKDGVKTGAIVTCATIYQTFERVGLEKDNILFEILSNLALQNGCADLTAYIKEIQGADVVC